MAADREERPDPDALLRRVSSEQQRSARAKLKIYFGFAPGVGKTYAMLQAAQRLRAARRDVTVGVVETHGRDETAALLRGLEVIPKRTVTHRGMSIEEFDLDQTLKRRPGLVLVDELAHTNAPTSRHAKRWQDVLELLDAGIDVYATLNVQHVESLNDVVAQITGVRVRETVPDAVLERADAIELIDLSADELLQRLADGRVYLGAQAGRAAQHFFQRGNLLALREIALRRAAERVDADVRAYREEHEITAAWPAAERILVCVSAGASAPRLIRSARRMAVGLKATWVAVTVEVAGLGPVSDAARARVEGHLQLAESLGATVVRVTSHSVSDAVLDYARRSNVTRIIVGKPRPRRFRGVFSGSPLDRLVRLSGDIDVHVMTGDPGADDVDERERPHTRAPSAPLAAFGWSLVTVLLTTSIAAALEALVAVPDVEMLYLVGIMIVAAWLGRGPSVAAAALSVLAYNFVFVEPRLTFAISDSHYWLTFAMMFGVGLLISTLTLRMRRQESDAILREERTSTLYALSRELGSAVETNQIVDVALRHVAATFHLPAAVFLPDATGALGLRRAFPEATSLETADTAVAQWVFEHGRLAGVGTDTLPGARVVCMPLGPPGSTVGVLALVPAARAVLRTDQRHFVDACARQIALAMERVSLAEDARVAALRAKTEELRSSLLSAVSHDLRTPLAAITGAGTTLRDQANIPEATRQELLESICDEAERLERLVANLLDMTRLASGDLTLKREWTPVEELVEPALTRLSRRLEGRRVTTDLPETLPLVSVDPVLFEQLLLNLLENACKYTPEGSPIEISARGSPYAVELEVADRGPGLRPGEEARIFEKFYRGEHLGTSGVGLGLAISKAIAEAHGGALGVRDRPGGGAVFCVVLPASSRGMPAMPGDNAPEAKGV